MGPTRTRQPNRRWIAIGSVGLILLAAFAATARAGTSCADSATWIDSALDDGRVPVRRAAMVWTGSEALIWGGEIGYRFDPLTSGWSVMSSVGAPDGYGPVYAWTGTELLVWGGTLSSATSVVTTDGGRYSPATDSWSPINPNGAPTGRRDAASVWTGTEWIIWGGREADGTRLEDGAIYDPVSDGWTAIPAGPGGLSSPEERYGHTLTWADGEVLLVGGQDRSLFSFDPVANAWTFLTFVPDTGGRTFHATAWTGTELLIYGGKIANTQRNTGWRYEPTGGVWTAMSTIGAPAPGASTEAEWTGSELVVWSGDGTASGRYDPATDSWAPVTTTGTPVPRSLHSLAWLGDRLMVWGGGLADGGTWDPLLDAWTPTDPSLPTRPMRNQVALVDRKRAVVLGWTGGSRSCHGQWLSIRSDFRQLGHDHPGWRTLGPAVPHRGVDRNGDDRLGRSIPFDDLDPLRRRRALRPGQRFVEPDDHGRRTAGTNAPRRGLDR